MHVAVVIAIDDGVDFRLGFQPVGHRVAPVKAALLGEVIGGLSDHALSIQGIAG